MTKRAEILQQVLDLTNKAGGDARVTHIRLTRVKGFKKNILLQFAARHYYNVARVNYEIAAFLESLLHRENRK